VIIQERGGGRSVLKKKKELQHWNFQLGTSSQGGGELRLLPQFVGKRAGITQRFYENSPNCTKRDETPQKQRERKKRTFHLKAMMLAEGGVYLLQGTRGGGDSPDEWELGVFKEETVTL